jgi:predicted ATPase/DNA-binding CsgD family transcriptional regulator
VNDNDASTSRLDLCPVPTQPGPLIGREEEQQAIRDALLQEDVRLLTLWGPGGIGKTRLALSVAADPALTAAFEDGVVFVDLTLVSDPSDVLPSIARALGLPAAPPQFVTEHVVLYLQPRQVLLVLDNLEHVVDVAAELAPLLASCPALKLLATSRTALRLRWEHLFQVGPLAAPRAPYPSDAATAASYSGVALFVARAGAARRDFRLTDANARVVAELCARLDGLPLALELAAARTMGLPLLILLARLEADRLALLQAGAPDLPARQRTLRRALAWSYDLLAEPQQALFRRLGVFVEGWSPEAAEAVCGEAGGGAGVLEGVVALVDASLVCLEEPPDGPPRYTMLATVRDYARRLLDEGGEAEEARRRHASYYLVLSEQGRAPLEHEYGNVRAAVEWASACEPSLLTPRPGSRLSPSGQEAASRPVLACPPAVRVNGCLEEFTRREREVIDLAVHGWSNRQIANQLVISERTAEGHIHNILSKLQLESRSQLAAWGARLGLVCTDEPNSSGPRVPAALYG